jgi:hypothetical protein
VTKLADSVAASMNALMGDKSYQGMFKRVGLRKTASVSKQALEGAYPGGAYSEGIQSPGGVHPESRDYPKTEEMGRQEVPEEQTYLQLGGEELQYSERDILVKLRRTAERMLLSIEEESRNPYYPEEGVEGMVKAIQNILSRISEGIMQGTSSWEEVNRFDPIINQEWKKWVVREANEAGVKYLLMQVVHGLNRISPEFNYLKQEVIDEIKNRLATIPGHQATAPAKGPTEAAVDLLAMAVDDITLAEIQSSLKSVIENDAFSDGARMNSPDLISRGESALQYLLRDSPPKKGMSISDWAKNIGWYTPSLAMKRLWASLVKTADILDENEMRTVVGNLARDPIGFLHHLSRNVEMYEGLKAAKIIVELSKVSHILDNIGFEKSAYATVRTLQVIEDELKSKKQR